MISQTCIPLTEAKPGALVQLVAINGGRKLARRIVELGLTPGVKLKVLHDSGGPMIIAVRDSRIALGRGMAEKLSVSLMEEN
jgi:Fe2+ transport system protein FeoA